MGSMTEAAESGNRLTALIELRDLIADRLDHARYDKDVSTLSKQFMAVTKEIDILKKENKEKVSSVSEMRKKLKAV